MVDNKVVKELLIALEEIVNSPAEKGCYCEHDTSDCCARVGAVCAECTAAMALIQFNAVWGKLGL